MSALEPTTYKTRSIKVLVKNRRDIERVTDILTDKRLNFQTVVEKLEQKDGATVQEITQPNIQTDNEKLGIRVRGQNVRATYVVDEWHNDSHEKVECDICGKTVLRLSYGKHKNSNPCRARKNKKEVEQRNLSRVSIPTRREIIREELDGNIEYLKTEYIKGYINKKSMLKGRYYAKKELVEKSKEIYIPCITDKNVKKHHIMCETEKYTLTRDKDGKRYVNDRTEYADGNKRVLYEKSDRLYTRNGYWYAEKSRTSLRIFTQRYLQDKLNTTEKIYI